jgi:hypothetical protein
MDAWRQNVAERLEPQGYYVLIESDEGAFRERAYRTLGVKVPPMYGTGKVWDYRPALGEMYAEEIGRGGFDYWGHTDFDIVYGRVERFWPDELIEQFDLITDHPDYVCGPWTLYRCDSDIHQLYARHKDWFSELERPKPSGWIETGFTELLRHHGAYYKTAFHLHHAWNEPRLLTTLDGALIHIDREVSFFHFRRTKKWPLSGAIVSA